MLVLCELYILNPQEYQVTQKKGSMDVYNMYMGDCSAYSPRQSMYRDYEKFPYGSLERNSNPQKSYYAMVQGKY